MDVDPTSSICTPVPALGTVLCAIDASPSAKAVLYAAAGLAADPGSRLVVLRVDDEKEAAEIALAEFAQQTVPGWLAYRQETELIARGGRPARTILNVAAEQDAHLIVMGTHSRGGFARLLRGSVVASVLLDTTIPVAVVPPSGPELFALMGDRAVPHAGSVLVPIDLGGEWERQLSFALTLAAASRCDVTLLNVISRRADSVAPLGTLQAIAAHARSRSDVHVVVTHGPLVRVIADRQARADAGVIVLGRDAASPGHVARELLETARAVIVFVP